MIGGVTRRGSSPVFVGRREELDRLAAAYARATEGRPSMVLIAGEAGVGKSRLVAELVSAVGEAGGSAAIGGCLDLGEGGLPYAPFTEALRIIHRSSDAAAVDEVFGPAAAALSTLIPELSSLASNPAESRSDPTGRTARLFDAVIGTLGRRAASQPLVLVLEDIHWADGSTRDLIRFLVRNVRGERLLMVATYRSDDLHRRHPLMPLLAELDRSEAVERLELPRFGLAELRDQLGGDPGPGPGVGGRGHHAPALGRHPVLRRRAGRSGRTTTLDPSRRRCETSSSSAWQGCPADRRTSSGRHRSSEGVARTIASRPSSRWITKTSSTPFATRSTPGSWYRPTMPAGLAIPSATRSCARPRTTISFPRSGSRLHARVADVLESLPAVDQDVDPAMITDFAVHAYLAHDQPRALDGAVRAMAILIHAAAFREALAHAERALELWPRVDGAAERTGVDRVGLLSLAARTAGNAGDITAAVAFARIAVDEVSDDDTPERLAGLLTDLWVAAWEADDTDLARSAAERALVIVDPLPPTSLKARVLLQAGSDRWTAGDHRAAITLYEASMAIATELGDAAAWVIAASPPCAFAGQPGTTRTGGRPRRPSAGDVDPVRWDGLAVLGGGRPGHGPLVLRPIRGLAAHLRERLRGRHPLRSRRSTRSVAHPDGRHVGTGPLPRPRGPARADTCELDARPSFARRSLVPDQTSRRAGSVRRGSRDHRQTAGSGRDRHSDLADRSRPPARSGRRPVRGHPLGGRRGAGPVEEW